MSKKDDAPGLPEPERENAAKAAEVRGQPLMAQRLRNGLCVDCGVPALPGIARCQRHNEQQIAIT